MDKGQEIKFYSVAEVSEILGISRLKAYEWVVSPYCPLLVMRKHGTQKTVRAWYKVGRVGTHKTIANQRDAVEWNRAESIEDGIE